MSENNLYIFNLINYMLGKTKRIAWVAAIGLIFGVAVYFLYPGKYSYFFDISRKPRVNYMEIARVVFGNTSGESAGLEREIASFEEEIDSAIRRVLADVNILSNSIDSVGVRYSHSDPELRYSEIVSIDSLKPKKDLESEYTPGFTVKVKFSGEDEGKLLVDEYASKLEQQAVTYVAASLEKIIVSKMELADIEHDSRKTKYEIDIENKIKILDDQISLAQIGGFAKPLVPSEIPNSSQIPVEQAVPQYFFGYEILQKEKDIASKPFDDSDVPGYSTYFYEKSLLKKVRDYIKGSTFDPIQIDHRPAASVSIETPARIAIALLFPIIFFLITLAYYSARYWWTVYMESLET